MSFRRVDEECEDEFSINSPCLFEITKHFRSVEIHYCKPNETRDAFPAVKIRKEGFFNIFNAWTRSHYSNFEVG